MPKLKLNIRKTTSEVMKGSRGQLHKSQIKNASKDITEREAASYETHQSDIKIERNDRAAVKYDDSQIDAISLMLTQQYACISGPAGTGKTTIMAKALEFLIEQVKTIDFGAARSAGRLPTNVKEPAIALCCFTNIATKNLSAKLDPKWDKHTMSIHSLLNYVPVGEDSEFKKGSFEPLYHKGNKLPYEVIIIDEAGVVSTDLWHALRDALEPWTRVYFLGDLFQMTPIHGASPMPFAIEKWPTAFLEKIYRQADGSPIISEAHNIRRGLVPRNHKGKVLVSPKERLPNKVTDARKYALKYINAIFHYDMYDPAQDIIITPVNGGLLGQERLNADLRNKFNPPRQGENGKLLNPPILIKTSQGAVDFMLGDKVMATSNGGKLATDNRFGNGSMGIITAIYPNPKYKGDTTGLGEMHVSDQPKDMMSLFEDTIEVDGKKTLPDEYFEEATVSLHNDTEEDKEIGRRAASHIIEVTETATGDTYMLQRSSEIATLKHAYAVTCHKFQGSQARRVVILLHTSVYKTLLSREWLYTAFTRARDAVILLHSDDALLTSVSRQQISGKTAKEKAINMVEKYEAEKQWRIPKLPNPENFTAKPALIAKLNNLRK